MRVNVGLKRALHAWARFLQGRDGQVTAADQIVEETAERVILILPETGGRTRPATKGGTRFSGNSVEWPVADGPTEGTQNRCLCGKDGSQGPPECHVGFNGTAERHVNPPRFSQATSRKASRFTLAWMLVLRGLRCPKWSPTSLKLWPASRR